MLFPNGEGYGEVTGKDEHRKCNSMCDQ